MAQSLLTLLVCQGLGELIHRVTALPLSGPIIGMIILLGLMVMRTGRPRNSVLRRTRCSDICRSCSFRRP